MNNLRILLAVLLLYIWAVFNVEAVAGADIHLSVVGRAFMACVPLALIMVPMSDTSSWKLAYAGFSALYVVLIGGYILLLEQPGSDAILAGAIVEFALLSLLFFLSLNLGRSISNRQESALDFSEVQQNNRMKTFAEALEGINNELDRGRRYEYSVCFISLKIEEQSFRQAASVISRDTGRGITGRYLKKKIGQQLSHLTRTSDIIAERQGNKGFYLVCPQMEERNLGPFIYKVQNMLGREMGLVVAFGAATFPEDSVDIDELLQIAEEKTFSPEEWPLQHAVAANEITRTESSLQ